eukprot:12909106-Prorocentrum_lima.AAC.1
MVGLLPCRTTVALRSGSVSTTFSTAHVRTIVLTPVPYAQPSCPAIANLEKYSSNNLARPTLVDCTLVGL